MSNLALDVIRKKVLFHNSIDVWISACDENNIDWVNTPAFVIFHDGASCDYLVLVWWENDNELFTSVSVKFEGVWVENPNKYSFCLYDLEIMWAERNIYIKTMDCESPSLKQYQVSR